MSEHFIENYEITRVLAAKYEEILKKWYTLGEDCYYKNIPLYTIIGAYEGDYTVISLEIIIKHNRELCQEHYNDGEYYLDLLYSDLEEYRYLGVWDLIGGKKAEKERLEKWVYIHKFYLEMIKKDIIYVDNFVKRLDKYVEDENISRDEKNILVTKEYEKMASYFKGKEKVYDLIARNLFDSTLEAKYR